MSAKCHQMSHSQNSLNNSREIVQHKLVKKQYIKTYHFKVSCFFISLHPLEQLQAYLSHLAPSRAQLGVRPVSLTMGTEPSGQTSVWESLQTSLPQLNRR